MRHRNTQYNWCLDACITCISKESKNLIGREANLCQNKVRTDINLKYKVNNNNIEIVLKTYFQSNSDVAISILSQLGR